MQHTIWKYILRSNITLEIPKGAHILSVHVQDGSVCMWAKVDPTADTESRKFMVVGTGDDIPAESTIFIGTVLMHDAALVFHVFELIPRYTKV